MSATTALVFCGGGPSAAGIDAPEGALVVAADSGVAEARRRGLRVDLLVGDLDSVSAEEVASVERGGGRVQRHPIDKDASDLELAIDAAAGLGATHIVVVGGDGGRLDHVLANALLLSSPAWAKLQVDAAFGASRAHVVRGRRELSGRAGEPISLLAVGGPARGVRTTGLRWALDGDDLQPGSTRGLSNVFTEGEASVEVAQGVVLAVRPEGGTEP